MRKTLITLVLSLTLLALTAGAERVVIDDAINDIEVKVLESNDSRTVIQFDIGAFEKEAVNIDGEAYYKIQCGNEGAMLDEGAPELPMVCRSIIIPDNAQMTVNILSSQYVEYNNTPVCPSKGSLLRTVNPDDIPYTFGDAYSTHGYYPADLAHISDPFIFRDYRGTVARLNLFQYNHNEKILRVYNSVTVELLNIGPGQINVISRRGDDIPLDPTFEQIYQRRFINHGETKNRYPAVEETGEILIITADAFHSTVTPLVEWKLQKGIKTTVVDVSTIGNTSTQIYNYIDAFYDSHNLGYVLLIGDAAQIAVPYDEGDSDPYYSKVDGSDNWPDIFVGRLSAENTTDLETQVERVINYEKTPYGTAWYQKATGVASTQGTGDDGEYDHEHLNNIRDDLLAYGYTEVDQIYGTSATAAMVTTALNNGRGLVNYTGHGSTTSWSTTGFNVSNVNSLTNDNMLPFIFSVACVNGNFNGHTCFAEAWLRATNSGVPTGAIATYMSSINQSWSEPMEAQDEANYLIVNEAKTTVGGICYNGACKMMETYGLSGTSIRMFKTWHIFGDPSVMVYTKNPAAMSVSHASSIPADATGFEVTVSGVEGALCALYYDGTLYGSAYTNAGGVASITIDGSLPESSDISLTVTAFNKDPYITTVPVESELVINSIMPNPNSLDIDPSTIIYVSFSTAVNASTMNSNSFKVIGKTTGQYSGVITNLSGGIFFSFDSDEDFKSGEEITVVMTDDIMTSGGTPLENGYSWSFIVENCGYADFGGAYNYNSEYRPFEITMADYNDDGYLDVATCSKANDNIAVLLNNGSGAFPTYTASPEGAYNVDPQKIHSADFNNDGDIDLVTANRGNSTLTVYLNDGTGHFPEYSFVTTDIDYDPFDCYPADINHDGNMDVVVVIIDYSHYEMKVFPGNGDGSFGYPMYAFTFSSSHNPMSSCAADLNNDGYMDLVYGDYNRDEVTVYLSNGTGSFIPTPGEYDVVEHPMDLGIADFDGDGYQDIATCGYYGDVSILINQQDGTFCTATTVPLTGSLTSLMVTNFDDDGDIDLAVAIEGDYAAVLYNDGSGAFGSADIMSVGDNPRGIFAGDIDGDGSADIVTANQYGNNISVIKNNSLPAAPGLLSPANGQRFPRNSQITLQCSTVPTATIYSFEIDDDPAFGSPQTSGLHFSPQWVVSPTLSTAGTYYWRVRVANACGYGNYSATRTLVVYTTGGGSSCPVLFSYDGNEFVAENPLLTACEKSGYADVVTDYYHVTGEVAPVNGKITFLLKEMEEEITYLEDFELITVDHSAESGIGCSVDGNIFTYESSVAPISVVDAEGVDWTETVANTDGNTFASMVSGELFVTFPNMHSSAGINVNPVAKSACPYEPPVDPPKAGVYDYKPSSMVIEQMDENGQWVLLSDVPSRESAATSFIMSDPVSAGDADNITIRISWEGSFSTDEIRQYIPSDEMPIVKNWTADNFRLDLLNPPAKSWIGFESSGILELRKHESITFAFDVDEMIDPSMTRDYIVRAVGRYHPDYSVFTHLTPNKFQLYDNYPNPFNPETRICYDLPAAAQVNIEVINILGRHVATLVDNSQPAGHYEVIWNGRDDNNREVSSGIYLYRISAGDFTGSKKMILQK